MNRKAERFLDEGLDFGYNTYGKFGSNIISQPGSIAYQIFDKEEELKKIFGPIGLNLGGRSAPEIALSIISQIVSQIYRK